ncbi:MAG: hypothetical protein KatS3mg076_1052 [Candidatus Binatia bacterium]|nr:MAG: hypothetical protein KatS3mg076_1052 [Candidatus Binatia bacterium]
MADWTLRSSVPFEALGWLLLVPFAAAVVVVARLVVGLDSFGTFAPVIVSLAFVATGVVAGVVMFALLVAAGSLLRAVLLRFRLQIVARMGILLVWIAVFMVVLAGLGTRWGGEAPARGHVFPMLILASIVENFSACQAEFGTGEALRLAANTVLLSAFCAWVALAAGLLYAVPVFPELLATALACEWLCGRWTGLRLLEYWRFRAMGLES